MTSIDAPSTSTVTTLIQKRERSALLKSVGLPVGAILLLLTLFSLLSPSFLQPQTMVTILRESAVLLVVAVGMTFVILMGSIDLSVGATVTLAGLAAATIVTQTQSVVLAVLAGLTVGLVVGLVNGVVFAYAKVPSFLVTLGTSLVIAGVGLWFVQGRPVQVGNPGFLSISLGQFAGILPNLVVWAVLIWALASFAGSKTRFGRYTFAIGGAEAVSALAGIPIRRIKLAVLVLSAVCAAIAGILLTSRISAATPGMGDAYTLNAIAAVVIGGTSITGGVGGVHRTILGVLVITILSVGLNSMGVAPYTQTIIQGAVVVLAVALTLDRSKLSAIK